jgi:hypothetical protein
MNNDAVEFLGRIQAGLTKHKIDYVLESFGNNASITIALSKVPGTCATKVFRIFDIRGHYCCSEAGASLTAADVVQGVRRTLERRGML